MEIISIIQTVIMTTLIIVVYVIAYNKGKKELLDELFVNKTISAETYIKLINTKK